MNNNRYNQGPSGRQMNGGNFGQNRGQYSRSVGQFNAMVDNEGAQFHGDFEPGGQFPQDYMGPADESPMQQFNTDNTANGIHFQSDFINAGAQEQAEVERLRHNLANGPTNGGAFCVVGRAPEDWASGNETRAIPLEENSNRAGSLVDTEHPVWGVPICK